MEAEGVCQLGQQDVADECWEFLQLSSHTQSQAEVLQACGGLCLLGSMLLTHPSEVWELCSRAHGLHYSRGRAQELVSIRELEGTMHRD
jgi:hypothetical protein